MAAVTLYVERTNHDQQSIEWIRHAIEVCGTLDPRWQAPSRYGSLMLASLGDIDGSEGVLRAAARRHPGEPWYGFALGMSRYLHRGDPAGASRWLAWAGAIDGASPIYLRASQRLAVEAEQQEGRR